MISGIDASGEMKVSPIGLITRDIRKAPYAQPVHYLFKMEGKSLHHLMFKWMVKHTDFMLGGLI
jgi:hypothetical protein